MIWFWSACERSLVLVDRQHLVMPRHFGPEVAEWFKTSCGCLCFVVIHLDNSSLLYIDFAAEVMLSMQFEPN
jgi:hypothetical protein